MAGLVEDVEDDMHIVMKAHLLREVVPHLLMAKRPTKRPEKVRLENPVQKILATALVMADVEEGLEAGVIIAVVGVDMVAEADGEVSAAPEFHSI